MLHKAPAEGLCEYKREGDGGEQWLLLSSILPVEVAVSTTSNASTLKIHSDEIAGIREVAGWVPGQQECKQGGRAARAVAANTGTGHWRQQAQHTQHNSNGHNHWR